MLVSSLFTLPSITSAAASLLLYSATCLMQPPVGQLCLTFIERWLLYRGRLQCFSAMLMTWEAGCFRVLAALHSDHLRQVPL